MELIRLSKLSGLILAFISLSINSLAQIELHGSIKNMAGEPLSRINILVFHPENNTLLAYAISSEKGEYELLIKVCEPDSIRIEISAINYRNAYKTLPCRSQALNFYLEEEVVQLDDVVVKAPHIIQKGDTLSYLVSSFEKKEDRSIEDVLRHMPGIEIEPNGKILYEGLPLKKFYVEGLDLMNGRYTMISKNLPSNAVGTVEVLENHQPIKILEERSFSTQASLNLKLKRNVAYTGTAETGTGVTPFLWDVNLTPMLFTKNLQVLTSYQTNNTGKEGTDQLTKLTSLEKFRTESMSRDIIYLQDAAPADLSKERYLDNNLHLINCNALQKINNDFQIRTNVFYTNNLIKQQSSIEQTIIFPDSLFVFRENIQNRSVENDLYGEITLLRNVKKNYFENVLKLQSSWNSYQSNGSLASKDYSQHASKPLQSISNKLHTVYPVGKHLIDLYSYISYENSSQSLRVQPGPFPEILNKQEYLKQAIQSVNMEQFLIYHSASMLYQWNRFTFAPELGINYKHQIIQSNLVVKQDENETLAGSRFMNDLNGSDYQFYGATKIEYRSGKFLLSTYLPLSMRKQTIDDETNSNKLINDFITFEPEISLTYTIKSFWKLRGMWSYSDLTGQMDKTYPGYILRNFSNLRKNELVLPRSSTCRSGIHLSYRNPITSFFNNFSYIYANTTNQLLYKTTFNPDGTSIVNPIEQSNKAFTHSLRLYSSKYFPVIKTTFSFLVNYLNQTREVLLNDNLFNAKSNIYILKPQANIKFTAWLNANYSLTAQHISTIVKEQQKNNISRLTHQLDVFAFPYQNQMFSISSEYYDINGNQNIFMDFSYRYTFSEKEIDILLTWSNIFNNDTYTTYQNSRYIIYQSTYYLRPSQILMSIKFSF